MKKKIAKKEMKRRNGRRESNRLIINENEEN